MSTRPKTLYGLERESMRTGQDSYKKRKTKLGLAQGHNGVWGKSIPDRNGAWVVYMMRSWEYQHISMSRLSSISELYISTTRHRQRPLPCHRYQ